MYTKGRRTKGSREQRIKDASFNKLPFKNRHPQKISTNYTCKSRDKTIEAQYDRFLLGKFLQFCKSWSGEQWRTRRTTRRKD